MAVMAIDIQTGQRSVGSYIPMQPSQSRDLSIIYNLFVAAKGVQPNNPVLSPDGKLLATFDFNGFVVIYRLTKSYDELMAEEANSQSTRQAQEPRSIGLLPTATPQFRMLERFAHANADHHAGAAGTRRAWRRQAVRPD
jgi:hypothetical protein